MTKNLRLNHYGLFTVVLLTSILSAYLIVDQILTFFPKYWGWSLQYIVHHGLNRFNVNSAFFMMSAIIAILVGLYVTDGIRRGFKNTLSPKTFLLPLIVAMILEFLFRGIEQFFGTLSVTILHTGLIVSWLMTLYLIRVVRLYVLKK